MWCFFLTPSALCVEYVVEHRLCKSYCALVSFLLLFPSSYVLCMMLSVAFLLFARLSSNLPLPRRSVRPDALPLPQASSR